jgi:hypothetical protein
MASQGPLNGATFTTNAPGDFPWAAPGAAAGSNDDAAAVTFTVFVSGETTEGLHATNFSFSIPAGATIDGIIVEVERSKTFTSVFDLSVKLIKGGTVSGNDKLSADAWPDTDAYKTYGSASDLWGLTWTVSDINASNFGMQISAQEGGSGGGGEAFIDHIRITVHYTAAATTSNRLMLLGVGP